MELKCYRYDMDKYEESLTHTLITLTLRTLHQILMLYSKRKTTKRQ